MPLQARHIFLTGQPGVGKTTLACAAVKEQPASCGFYTAEKRAAAGEREGFSVVALGSGETGDEDGDAGGLDEGGAEGRGGKGGLASASITLSVLASKSSE